MLGTQIIPDIMGTGSFTTSSASQAGSDLSGKRNATIILLTKIIVPLSVILLIMVFIMMILIVVIIKRRRKWKTHSEVHQGEWN